MLGQFLWALAYTKINLQALPGIHAKAEANDEDPEVGAWRMIYPRAYLNNVAQQSMAFYEAFAESQGLE